MLDFYLCTDCRVVIEFLFENREFSSFTQQRSTECLAGVFLDTGGAAVNISFSLILLANLIVNF